MSYKQEKIIVIMSEFINDKREYYPITNVPIEKARFFYKDDDGLFKVMSSSDYAVRTESNETRLYITNEKIKTDSLKFQMGYEINFSASEYETSLPVLSVLVEMYNSLVEDSRTIFNYVKKQCFISDDKTTTLILPKLPAYTVWCMGNNNEMFALPVDELYERFEKLLQAIYKKVLEMLTKDYQTMLKGLEDKAVELKNQLQVFADKLEKDKKALIDDYVEKTSKTTINNHVETVSKPEINKYVENTTKPSIDKYVNNTSKPELNNYVNNVLKKNLDEYNTVKKQEIDQVKTDAINEIVVQENSTLQNILNAESKSVKAVEDKGIEERKTLEDMGVDIKTQLELLLQNADIANLQTLIGNCYKGVYSAFNKYYSGDIYYKKDTEVVALTIPDRVSNTVAMLIPAVASPTISKEMTSENKGTMTSPILSKTSSAQNIKKFFRLYGDIEREYNFTDNGDNKIVGFELGDYNRFIRTNSTVELEFNTINYTVAVNFPNTEVTDLIKALTTEQDNSAATLVKKQTDLPLYTLDTQRDPVLRKIHY